MRLLKLFWLKGYLEEHSYRFQIGIRIIKLLFTLIIFYYFSQFVTLKNSDALFPMLFSGHLFYEFFLKYLKVPGQLITSEQYKGTLPILLNTPISPVKTIFLLSSYQLSWDIVLLILYIILGGIYFQVTLSMITVLFMILLMILIWGMIFSWGILGGSVVLLIKRGDPFTSGLLYFALLGGGLYFPIKLLPAFIQWGRWIFPLEQFVTAFRGAFFNNQIDFSILLISLGYLIVLLPLSLFSFKYAVRWCKRKGTLGVY